MRSFRDVRLEKIQKMIKAYVLGTVNAQKEEEVLKTVSAVEGVEKVEFVYGKYDFIAHINAEDETKLSSFILDKMRKLPDVISTQTLIAQKI